MHLILALLAAAACIALGLLAAGRLSARERALNAWEGALRRMEGAVAQGGQGVAQVLRRGAGDNVPMLQEAAGLLEKEPALAPEALISRLAWDPLLTPAERDVLREGLAGLFSPSPELQLRALGYAREQWALFLRLGREALEKNARLYASLGWLAGAAVFILMC